MSHCWQIMEPMRKRERVPKGKDIISNPWYSCQSPPQEKKIPWYPYGDPSGEMDREESDLVEEQNLTITIRLQFFSFPSSVDSITSWRKVQINHWNTILPLWFHNHVWATNREDPEGIIIEVSYTGFLYLAWRRGVWAVETADPFFSSDFCLGIRDPALQ